MIDHVCADTFVDGDDVLIGVDSDKWEYQYQ